MSRRGVGPDDGRDIAREEPLVDPMIDIIRRALAGEQRAMRALLDEIGPAIQASVSGTLVRRTTSAARSRARHDVEDLTQEVLYALLANDGKRLRAWDPDKGLTLPRYVRLVARHLVISFLRKRERRVWEDDAVIDEEELGATDVAASPERLSEYKEMYEAVLNATEADLTAQGRKVLHMLVIDGRPVADVAAELSVTPNAVHVWRTRLAQRIDAAKRRVFRGTYADE